MSSDQQTKLTVRLLVAFDVTLSHLDTNESFDHVVSKAKTAAWSALSDTLSESINNNAGCIVGRPLVRFADSAPIVQFTGEAWRQ